MYHLKPEGKSIPYFLFILFSAVITSCNIQGDKKPGHRGYADDPFAEKLQTIFKPIDTTSGKNTNSIAEKVRYTYQMGDYLPIWVKENYLPNEAAQQLVEELEDMRWDGIDP